MELWDEELHTDAHGADIFTLPEMELPFDDMGELMTEIRRVTAAIVGYEKFPVILGGEHSITAPVVAAVAAQYPGVSVLQIDAQPRARLLQGRATIRMRDPACSSTRVAHSRHRACRPKRPRLAQPADAIFSTVDAEDKNGSTSRRVARDTYTTPSMPTEWIRLMLPRTP